MKVCSAGYSFRLYVNQYESFLTEMATWQLIMCNWVVVSASCFVIIIVIWKIDSDCIINGSMYIVIHSP